MMSMAFPIGKNKQIHFISEYDQFPPVTAKSFIPQWYKVGEQTFTDENGTEWGGIKKCIPFLDIMISGYMLLLPEDIEVKNGAIISNFVSKRYHKMGATVPVPTGHVADQYVWQNTWGWKTPKKWSTLLTHPYNRFDLPFTTLSGLVDSDSFVSDGNIPFYIKAGFSGVIKAGTPIAQLIPIKRSIWKSHVSMDISLFSKYSGKEHYKKFDWKRKQYD